MAFEEYIQELADPSRPLRASRLALLSGLTREQARELGRVWPELDVRRRRRLIRELAELAEDNVELNFDAVFLRGLGDADEDVRIEAVGALWEYEKPDVIPQLLRLLADDASARVRAEAALALGRFILLWEYGKLRERHFAAAEAGLRQALEKADEIQEVRARALEAIGPHNSAWVRQAIREAYESDARGLKVSAVHAMGRSCEGRWLPLLLRELSSEEAEVRYEAALACGGLGDQRAVSPLAALLTDPDDEVREAAVTALGSIGGDRARSLLVELRRSGPAAMREAADEALAEIDFDDDPLSFKQRF